KQQPLITVAPQVFDIYAPITLKAKATHAHYTFYCFVPTWNNSAQTEQNAALITSNLRVSGDGKIQNPNHGIKMEHFSNIKQPCGWRSPEPVPMYFGRGRRNPKIQASKCPPG